jgi:hypothetical protein
MTRMPVPSSRLKDLIEGTVDHHASQRWPALEEVTIRWRGSYGYLTGYLSEDDDDTIPLCRIQYLGDPDKWAFAIWQASTETHADSVALHLKLNELIASRRNASNRLIGIEDLDEQDLREVATFYVRLAERA